NSDDQHYLTEDEKWMLSSSSYLIGKTK
ncbi:hypothetical protein NPIL_375231, partial [Nephila pilipes]